MNPNYLHTITVYNRVRGQDNPSKKDTWTRMVLTDCFYKNVIGKIEDGKTVRMGNVYTARIPESEKYIPYHEFAKLTEEERTMYFTFNLGDIVVYGACQEEITGTSPNTAAEFLERMKPDAFKVTAFSDNTSHIYAKHYRVGG